MIYDVIKVGVVYFLQQIQHNKTIQRHLKGIEKVYLDTEIAFLFQLEPFDTCDIIMKCLTS